MATSVELHFCITCGEEFNPNLTSLKENDRKCPDCNYIDGKTRVKYCFDNLIKLSNQFEVDPDTTNDVYSVFYNFIKKGIQKDNKTNEKKEILVHQFY
jgi:DNA-directed RNA polymerase subunit RPC12/RpoP